jgi:hypothetical protein
MVRESSILEKPLTHGINHTLAALNPNAIASPPLHNFITSNHHHNTTPHCHPQ